MPNYFFAPADLPAVGRRDEAANDDFLFRQGPTKGLGKIRFHDYAKAYGEWDLPNVNVFKDQIGVFRTFLAEATPDEAQQKDIDFLMSLGEIFTLVVYGQLILENASIYGIGRDLVDQIFDFMVRDFSKFALQLHGKASSTPAQMDICLRMIRKPAVDDARYQRAWQEVYELRGVYEMSP
jgi:acyl-CoA dehydrogenase